MLTLPLVFPASAAGKQIKDADFHLQQPHMLQYNLTVERQLPWNMAATLAYAGSRGINLNQYTEGNPIMPRGTPTVVNGQLSCLNVTPQPAFNATGQKCRPGPNHG